MLEVGAITPEPVTGREDHSDPTRPMHALAGFYAALNGRSIDAMAANWDHGPEVAMDNPLGGIMRGWSNISMVYQKLFASPAPYRFEFHDYQLYRTSEIFFVVGRERGEIDVKDGRFDLAIRTTRIFVQRPDAWRQIHHHGSIDDPDMLRRYLSLVRGT